MAVDGDLGVHVEVVEQRERARERVRVGRDSARWPGFAVVAEQLEPRFTVAAFVRAKDLVVGAVLADDVEDVLDLLAGARPRRRDGAAERLFFGVVWPHLPVGDSRLFFDLQVGGKRQHADAPEQHVEHVWAFGGTRTVALARDPDQLRAIGGHLHVVGIGGGR